MAEMDAQRTLGELVCERPSRSRVLEELGLDYCCGGKVSLESACQSRGLDLEQVCAKLSDVGAAPDERDWSQASLTELADHIEATHHEYLRRELPRLGGMVKKVHEVHGDRHPWLADLHRVFDGLREELEAHLMKEERILFPYLRGLDQGGSQPSCFGTVRNPIAMMEHEHDQAGHALAAMRAMSSDYTPPADGCNTFRAMLDGLDELERDLHQHIHKENNILFPRGVAREAELA